MAKTRMYIIIINKQTNLCTTCDNDDEQVMIKRKLVRGSGGGDCENKIDQTCYKHLHTGGN